MRIKRRDAAVLERSLVVAQRLLERGPAEAELDEVARGEPVEALLAAMTLDETGVTAARLGRYLDVGRHVRLEITGSDLMALGFPSSPRMGEVLRSVLRLKLNGVLEGRDQELAAAARLREEGNWMRAGSSSSSSSSCPCCSSASWCTSWRTAGRRRLWATTRRAPRAASR